jgi:hypothetical protein
MDRWVDVITSLREPNASIYIDERSRYSIGLGILYFCSAMLALDSTLYEYWSDRYKLSEEKLTDPSNAKHVTSRWEWYVHV